MTTFYVSRPLTVASTVTTAINASVTIVTGPALATAFTLTGPTSGTTGTASTFTVTPNGTMGSTVTVTPAATNAGSVFPLTLTFTVGSTAAQNFTVNRTSDGTSVVSITNNGTLSNLGTPISYATTSAAVLGWNSNIFPMTIQEGGFFDLAPHINAITQLTSITPNIALPTGVAITSQPTWRMTAASNATVGNTNGLNLLLGTSGAGDFATRISGPNVVWYHSFDSAAEVNQFRFTNSVAGNDPNNVGTNGTPPVWVSSGGADGGGFMRITYPVNVKPDTSYWARPFFPIDAAGNGRGVADPGANGTIATQSWNFPQGGTTGFDVLRRTNPGFYGPAGRQAIFPAKFQGTDYWLQIRVRRAQTPGKPPDNPADGFTSINGKFVWFTCTGASFTNGEIVTFGQSSTTPHVPPDATNGDQVGVQSYTNAYTFTGDFSTIAHKTGGTVNINNESIGWRYTGGWDTLLFHVTPGEIGGTGNQRTRWEVWAQRNLTQFPAEAGLYQKIWDVFFPAAYETGTDSAGGQYAGGWNCLNLAIYHNLTTFTTTSFSYDYDQVIFAKGDGTNTPMIPAPTA